MTVFEQHMGVGSWALTLRPDTPPSVLDQLDLDVAAFGHIIVTPAPIDATAVAAADLISRARYTGVVRSRPSLYELGGPGLGMWLADEDNKGDVLETQLTKSAGTFVQWVTDLCPTSLDVGTLSALAGSLSHTFLYVDRRTALDYVCDYFGGEWRITPAGVLDAGAPSNLFTTTPTTIAVRRDGSREATITGIRATKLEVDRDLDDYTTRVVLLANGSGAGASIGTADISPATTFRDLNGNLVEFTRILESSDTQPGNENAVAQAQLNRFTAQRRAIELSTDTYNVRSVFGGSDFGVGDSIYVYDPQRDLVDTANQVPYRGEIVFPISLRILGYTWPVRRGMGVYFRAPTVAGAITDLTEWVDWETSDATIEVGATSRSLVDDTSTATSIERPASLGPQGSLALCTRGADQTGIGAATALTSLSKAVKTGVNRRLRFGFRLLIGVASNVNQGVIVQVIESGIEVARLYQDNDYPRVVGGSTSDRVISGTAELDPTAGSHTYELWLGRVGAAGTIGVFGSQIQSQFWIEDIGIAV